MRAVVVENPGPVEALHLTEVALPEPGAGQVRIRVEAAGVNPVDVQTRGGVYHDLGWVTQDVVGIGWDVAGIVDAVGDDVDRGLVGTRVAGFLGGVDRAAGSYAEAVVLPAADIAPVPAGIAPEVAASVPLNATTASQALDLVGPARGRSLLVTGAAGAVGGFAVELARAVGFTVTGLARAGDADFVAASGARFVDALPASASFDAVLDAAAIGDAAVAAVVDGGAYVGVIPPAVPAAERDIVTTAVVAAPDGQLLRRLLADVQAGDLTARVARTLPLDQAQEAHQLLEAGGLRGRIVLVP